MSLPRADQPLQPAPKRTRGEIDHFQPHMIREPLHVVVRRASTYYLLWSLPPKWRSLERGDRSVCCPSPTLLSWDDARQSVVIDRQPVPFPTSILESKATEDPRMAPLVDLVHPQRPPPRDQPPINAHGVAMDAVSRLKKLRRILHQSNPVADAKLPP